MFRQRSRRACGPCRKRKVRCNGSDPCDVCEGYGYECDFAEDAKKATKRVRTEEVLTDALDTATSVTNDEHSVDNIVPAQIRAGSQRESFDNGQSVMLVEVPNTKKPVLSSPPFHESLISRFTTVYSAVAFPRDLGRSLGLSHAPRLHPFAWNTGTREERQPSLGNRLFDQISLQDTLQHANTYFKVLRPAFGFLDRTHFTRTCIAAWSLRKMPIDLEAAVCGVVALGSLFSSASTPWPMESAIVEQAKHLLDISVSSPPSQLSLKFVVAWLLRALYLRCTTRPHLSWMATCNAIHVAEAIGLHQEFGNMDVHHERPREVAVKEGAARRRTFWMALSLNRLFSIEYGRSPIQLDSINCSPLDIQGVTDLTADFVKLCQLLPKNNPDPDKLTEEREDLAVALQHLTDHVIREPPFALLKAEICFSIFRKMRFFHMVLTKPQIEAVLGIIRTGMLEAQSLSTTSSKWWSIISVPFHSVGVLIAIDSGASLGLLVNAMEALKTVVCAYNTHLAHEALQTAEQLVRGCRGRKLEEAHWVGQALEITSNSKMTCDEEQELQCMPQIPFGFEWPSEDDSCWVEVFFNIGME